MPAIADRTQVAGARDLAWTLLAPLGARWRHTLGVARRAAEVAVTLAPRDRETLLVAAWLHDVGYGADARDTGFHPLDGAAYLAKNGWPLRICGLVAHHSGAAFLARVNGLEAELDRYPDERSDVYEALTYADQTVGEVGQPLSIDERMAQMLARRGPDSAQSKVHHLRRPHLLAVAARVERRMAAVSGD
ncbi:MAG TPA: HD domain-containing protein [Micromonosporaceae bacterium]|jgi:putative nucleotidyltransferase with HDIG domain